MSYCQQKNQLEISTKAAFLSVMLISSSANAETDSSSLSEALDSNVVSQAALKKEQIIDVSFAKDGIAIDGELTENSWQQAKWYPLNFVILGEQLNAEDFSGQYALTWDEQALYLAVKFVDDKLSDQILNPIERYWDDDCLEIFIDEDASGGDHQTNHNAFAYHLALDGQAADIGTNGKAQLYNEHVENQLKSFNGYRIWESKIHVFPDQYQDDKSARLFVDVAKANEKPDGNTSMALAAGKQLGFMLAYCDNDGEGKREHFVGSHQITGVGPNNDKNLGYKTADVFGKIKLVK